MGTVEGILFIDANQYLDLYRTVTGKKVLPALQEQQDHIFVTAQVVSEVHRGKLEVAAGFLAEQFKNLKLDNIAFPDHLFSKTDNRVEPLRSQFLKIRNMIRETKEECKSLTYDLLEQISRSEDEVSKALAGIFDKAVSPNDDELCRARKRRELGNPPGKKRDPLGDQLSWEQILTCCKDRRKLWIITRDGDFATQHEDKMFLNATLFQEFAGLHESAPDVFCFANIPDAFEHFVSTTDVKAEKLPTPEDSVKIKREQESLPPLGWLESDFDYVEGTARQNAYLLQLQQSAALRAALLSNQSIAEAVIPPPESKETDKDPH